MNSSLIVVEILVALLGLGVLLADLWMPATYRRRLGWIAAGGLAVIFFVGMKDAAEAVYAFGAPGAKTGMYVQDSLGVFFKQFFLPPGLFLLLLVQQYLELWQELHSHA